MFTFSFHAFGWDAPYLVGEIYLAPLSPYRLGGSCCRQDREFECAGRYTIL